MTCLNRVAQHPLQLKLQVFKTVSRGWGLQCLNDVPEGSFICVYVGDLLTDTDANIAGGSYGDEYLAELDYIEVVESLKEDYESEVMMDDEDVASEAARQHKYNTRHSVDDSNKKKIAATSRSSDSHSDEEDPQRQLIGFVPNANSDVFENSSSRLSRSIHQFYGKNERVFTIDAKKQGNIGRYFNVSKIQTKSLTFFTTSFPFLSTISILVHRIYSSKMFSWTHTIFDFRGSHFLLSHTFKLAVN